ncbi:hypothetical protein C8T65DRAFT_650216 [Cerioporus squamosus]|nr:hypothetical protein C8T65DRAFT_650216 [Cerioporus squamosus]
MPRLRLGACPLSPYIRASTLTTFVGSESNLTNRTRQHLAGVQRESRVCGQFSLAVRRQHWQLVATHLETIDRHEICLCVSACLSSSAATLPPSRLSFSSLSSRFLLCSCSIPPFLSLPSAFCSSSRSLRFLVSSRPSKMPQRSPDFIPIEFLIVGGSICGLSSAIALRRAGHKVTVFDIANPFEATQMDAGCRLPPNSTKMYYRWGLEERLHACAVKSKGTLFAQCTRLGSVVGAHEWQEDVLMETGGDFLLIHYTDIRRILAECAAEHGATIRYGPENQVAKITAHATAPSITLVGGEVISADVVVGADGYLLPGWIARKYMLEAHKQEDTKTPTGMQMFNVIVREADLVDQEECKEFLETLRTDGKVMTWYGSQYGAFGYPMAATTGEPAFTLYVYAPLKGQGDGFHAWTSSRDALLDSIKGADPRLMQLAKHAASVSAIPVVDHPMLEDWVHPTGRVIAIGEAAHPTPVGSPYAFGMSTGDAAVLGRLFTHLHRPEQIDSFLSAVQEIRQSRVQNVMKASAGNIFAVSLPPGMAEARDRALRERAEKGIEGLASGQTSEQMKETIESVFGYDPEDEADNWWVEWGAIQERAERWTIRDEQEAGDEQEFDFGVATSTVTVTESAS